MNEGKQTEILAISHNLLKGQEKSAGNKFVHMHDIQSVTIAFDDEEASAHKSYS